MLYLVLILVIVAFGLLIAALTTANTIWAWTSVAISVLAAGLLIFDWVRGRRRVAGTSVSRAAEPADVGQPEPEQAELVASTTEIPPVGDPVSEQPVTDEPAAEAVDDDEPAEEATDAADLLIVSELSAEVRVVDEHPRYHLSTCGWLSGKATLALPVSEARELGFTPCARCGPDAVLAAQRRSGKRAKQ